MRMLFLYSGGNSGTNQALLRAWRAAGELEIQAHDLRKALWNGLFARLRMLPHALREGGPSVLVPGGGRLFDAAKRSSHFMRRLRGVVRRIDPEGDFDFSLAIGSACPAVSSQRPHFIYTDLPMLANLHYPDGRARVTWWRRCLDYERQALHEAAAVFTMSSHVTRSMIEQYGLPPDRVVQVNGGCNTPPIERPDPDRFARQNVLFIGVDWQRKGGPEVLEAFTRIRAWHPQATLTIVGCRPEVEAEGVQVVGPVPQNEIPRFLERASVFCMPSRREPFGIAYLEAMRAGLPVIAADQGAAADFVLSGRTGYRVSPGDVDALTARLDELLWDADLCRRLGEAGRELVESQYTWSRTQRLMWETIQTVLSQPTPAA